MNLSNLVTTAYQFRKWLKNKKLFHGIQQTSDFQTFQITYSYGNYLTFQIAISPLSSTYKIIPFNLWHFWSNPGPQLENHFFKIIFDDDYFNQTIKSKPEEN